MKTTCASLLRRVAVLAAIGGLNLPALGTIVFDLNSVITGDSPAAAGPWLRATLSQFDANTVSIKMETVKLTGNESVKDWAFNLNPTIAVSSITAVEHARSGTFKPDSITLSTAVTGYGGFSFDFDFDFQPGSGPNTFSQGDSVTMHLSRSGGLQVSDFVYKAPHNSGAENYYTGAHVQNTTGTAGSGHIGATTVVPEPSTYIMGGLALLPLLFGLRSRLVKKD